MSKRSIDEAGLSKGSRPPNFHTQKKRKTSTVWQSVAVEASDYETETEPASPIVEKHEIIDLMTDEVEPDSQNTKEPVIIDLTEEDEESSSEIAETNEDFAIDPNWFARHQLPSFVMAQSDTPYGNQRAIDMINSPDELEDSGYQTMEASSPNSKKRTIDWSDSEAPTIILPRKKAKTKSSGEPNFRTKKIFQKTRDERKRDQKNRKLVERYTRRLYARLDEYEYYNITAHYVSPPPPMDLFKAPKRNLMNRKLAAVYRQRMYSKLDHYTSFDISKNYISRPPPTTDLFNTHGSTLAASTSSITSIHQGGTSPGTFPQFQKLHQELRDMIWELSILPRVIPLTARRDPKKPHPLVAISMPFISTTAPIPAQLHVCRDSRKVALQHYTLSFTRILEEPRIYFDFENDMALFKDKELTNGVTAYDYPSAAIVMMTNDLKKITHLALNKRSSAHFANYLPLFALKTLDVVLHDFQDPYLQNTPLSYAQMADYHLPNALFQSTKSENFATRKFMNKYQLLRKETFFDRNSAWEPSELAKIARLFKDISENGEGIKCVVVIAGGRETRKSLMDVVAKKHIQGVVDESGMEIMGEGQ